MRERIGALRGSVTVENDNGAAVIVRVPLNDALGR
jgi:glucose-6-phosphate-specific signal transduction histidine kinase